jgi:hypothetical protein
VESAVNLAWAYSNKRQSAYATASPNADIDQSHPFIGADMGEHTPNSSDNAEHFGKGHEFATRNEILSWDTMFRRQFHATTKIVGWALAFHTGSVSTTNLGGSPAAYSHEFEYQDPNGSGYYGSGRQQPAVSIIERVATDLVRKFPSMTVKAVELAGADNDWITLTVEMQGSGAMSELVPSSYTFPDSTTTDDTAGGEGRGLLRNAALTFEHGVSGALNDESCDIKNWRWRSEMQYFEQEGYCPGSGYLTSGDPTSGQIRNKLEFSRRAVLAEFTIKAARSATWFDRLRSNTRLVADITVEGPTISGANRHSITLTMPEMIYRAVAIGADGDLITYAVNGVIMYNQTLGNPWTATVVNRTSAYLVSS